MNKDNQKVLMQGNVALCEGAIRANCDAYFGYPITPQNEVAVHMSRRMRELGRVFIQAESEVAAINMVLGTALTGKRAMTSSSSPGISLKQEGISYLAGCELPCVIANIARGGPGLGNISGSQGDYFQATKGGGHGDYRTIVLSPESVGEMYDLTSQAFNLADKYRIPVMILSDGYLGQMMEGVDTGSEYRILDSKKDWVLDGCKNRAPRKVVSLFMGEGKLEEHDLHLKKKYDQIIKNETRFELNNLDGAEIILVAFGMAARVCKGALELAKKEGLKVGLIRPVTLWPFPEKIISDIAVVSSSGRKKILVVEMNLGQMVEDVRLAVCGRCPVEFYGRPGGAIVTQEEILKKIRELNK